MPNDASKSAFSKSPNAKRAVTPNSTPGKNSPYQPLNAGSTKTAVTDKKSKSKMSLLKKRSKKDKNPAAAHTDSPSSVSDTTSHGSKQPKKSFIKKMMDKAKKRSKKENEPTDRTENEQTSDQDGSEYKVVMDPELERTTFERVAVKNARPAVVEDFKNEKEKPLVLGHHNKSSKDSKKSLKALKPTTSAQKQAWMKK